jgi:HlyD family secretion protein
LLLAAVAVAAAVVVAHAVSARNPQVRYDTEPVRRGDLTAKVTATGTLSALVTVQVGSQVSGRIQAIYVDFNSPVHKGELLAKIDPQLFQAAVAQAHANLQAARGMLVKAKANAANADIQYKRGQALFTQALLAAQDLDTARAADQSAHADVSATAGQAAQAEAALHQAQVNLGYTDIISPVDGTVISRNVDVGQTVASAFQSPVLFQIAEDLHQMQVDTSVAESDVGRLRAGTDATFTVDAYPGRVFRGTVRQVRNAPQTVQNVVTYDAVIDVANGDLALKPGMTANVTFPYAQVDGARVVPNAAFRWKPATVAPGSDQRSVWVLRGKSPERIMVTIGISDGTRTAVTGGPLQEGDRVVVDASGPGAAPGGSSSARPGFRVL